MLPIDQMIVTLCIIGALCVALLAVIATGVWRN